MLTRTTPLARWLKRLPRPRDLVTLLTVKLSLVLDALDARHQAWLEKRNRAKESQRATAEKVAASKAARLEFLDLLKQEDEKLADEMAELTDTILAKALTCAKMVKKKKKRSSSAPDRMRFGYMSFCEVTGGFLWVNEDAEILIDAKPLDLRLLHHRDLIALDSRMQAYMEAATV